MTKKKHNHTWIWFLIIVISVIISIIGVFLLRRPCSFEYEFEDGKCVKTVEMIPDVEYYCDNGYELIGTNCQKVETMQLVKHYSCVDFDITEYGDGEFFSEGTPTVVGSECKYPFFYEPYEQKECPPGCGLETDTNCICRIELPVTVQGEGVHRRKWCHQGYLDGDVCVYFSRPAVKITKYCGRTSYLSNGLCHDAFYAPANYTTSCPAGYEYNNNICVKVTLVDAHANYTCLTGYQLVDGYCIYKIIKDRKN